MPPYGFRVRLPAGIEEHRRRRLLESCTGIMLQKLHIEKKSTTHMTTQESATITEGSLAEDGYNVPPGEMEMPPNPSANTSEDETTQLLASFSTTSFKSSGERRAVWCNRAVRS